jgi:hypothetical protein
MSKSLRFLNRCTLYCGLLSITMLYPCVAGAMESTPPPEEPINPPVIITDRPSFSSAVQTVPKGSLQIENGITGNYVDDSRTTGYPETTLRLGVTPYDEIQLYLPTVLENRFPSNETTTGLTDVRLGVKHGFRSKLPYQLQASVNGVFSLPTGNATTASTGVDPTVNLILAKALTPRLSLTQQTGISLDTTQPQGKFSINPTLASSYTFTPRLAGFLEYASFIPIEKTSSHIVDAGLQYTFRQRHVLDARMGSGFFSGEAGFFVGVGYSYRFDGLFNQPKMPRLSSHHAPLI